MAALGRAAPYSVARTIKIILMISVIILAPLAAIVWATPPITVSGSIATMGNETCTYCKAIIDHTFDPPQYVSVSVHWNDVSGGQASFEYQGPRDATWVPCGPDGRAGSCTFIAQGGVYYLGAASSPTQYPQLVDYTVTYYG